MANTGLLARASGLVVAEPRHLILPEGIVSTGWPAVEAVSNSVGIFYDPWQQRLNRAILAKDQYGMYAANVVVIAICRQAGKTYDIAGLVFADMIVTPNSTTVWTAHRFPVARETFIEMKQMAEHPLLAPHIDINNITTAAGNEVIPFRNGSRILFKARERGSIRGFTKVRRLVLDEGQILTSSTLSDLAPTTAQADNPQILVMGTPPKPEDPGEVFSGYRSEALAGNSSRLLYVEYSADDDADPDDQEQWAKANPSFPHRTTVRAVELLRSSLVSDEDFLRECLGVWAAAGSPRVIDQQSWDVVADSASMAVEGLVLGIDVSPDRSMAAVGLAGRRADGSWHVELDEHRAGAGWVAGWVDARLSRNTIKTVVVDDRSAAATLVDELKEYGIRVTSTKAADMADACGQFFDGVMGGYVFHTDQPQLNHALGVARKRPLGDAWGWNRKAAESDITPLVAVTLALWGARQGRVRAPRWGSGRSGVSSGRSAVVL